VKHYVTNSAANPSDLCRKLEEASAQGFVVVHIMVNPEPEAPDSKWMAFLAMPAEGDR